MNLTQDHLRAKQTASQFAKRLGRNQKIAIIGNNAGTVDVTGRDDRIWGLLDGEPDKLIRIERGTSIVEPIAGTPIIVELARKNAAYYRIVGRITDWYANDAQAGIVKGHALQHQRRDFGAGGFDPIDVYTRALVEMRARAQVPANFTLYVEAGIYIDYADEPTTYAGGNSPTFSKPTGIFERRCDLLYFGNDHALHIVQGTVTVDGSIPAKPTQPDQSVAVAFVYLDPSMTAITEDYIFEARQLWQAINATNALPISAFAWMLTDIDESPPAGYLRLVQGATGAKVTITYLADTLVNVLANFAIPHNLIAQLPAGTAKMRIRYSVANSDISKLPAATRLYAELVHKLDVGTETVLDTQDIVASSTGTTETSADVTFTLGAPAFFAANIRLILRIHAVPITYPIPSEYAPCNVSIYILGNTQSSLDLPPGSMPIYLTDSHVFVGNAADVAADVAVSGDATMANTGALTIANGAVTLAKMANMATASLIYRKTAGSGAPEVNTLATLKTDLGTMPPTAHNILDSTYHSDVLTGSVVLGDLIAGNSTPKWERIAGNITTVQKFLSQTGNGTISALPSWQPIPVSGLLTFFLIDTASSIGGAYKQLVSSTNYTPAAKANIATSGATNGTVCGTFASNVGFPGLTFIPDGTFHIHIHAKVNSSGGSPTLRADIYKRDVGATETLIVSSEDTANLTNSEQEFDISAILTQPIALATTDRLVVKWVFVIPSGSKDVTIYYDGTGVNETFSRVEIPAASVDVGSFVPYTGATASVDLGIHTLTTPSINLSATSNQLVLQSAGVTGTLTWTPASSNKVITFPNLTGNIALGAGSITTTSTNDVTVASHTHAITAVIGLIGNASAQYHIPVSGSTPFTYAESGFLLDGTTGGKTILAVTNAKTLTLTATDTFNLTIPATGTAALLGVANVFTANQTISSTAPSLILTDTTASAKSLTVAVDANIADFRESAGASGSLLVLDLANNRISVGLNSPWARFQVNDTFNFGLAVKDEIAIQPVWFGGTTTDPSSFGSIVWSYSGTPYGRIAYVQNNAAANVAGHMEFWTTNAAGTIAEKLRIDSVGNVGIGTTGALSKLAINGGLHVGGDTDAGDNNLLVDGTATITGNTILTAKVTTYNNVATEGYGVGAIVDDVALTNQGADIGSTNFTNAGVAGTYLVTVYILTTTAAGGTGTVSVNLAYTDDAAARTVSAAGTDLTTTGAGGFTRGTIFIKLASGSIAYSTTNSGSYSTAKYALYMTCIRLS